MWIERSLANRHLRGGTLILYDVTSTLCRRQVLCACHIRLQPRSQTRQDADRLWLVVCRRWLSGHELPIEVFPGNSADPSTVATQISKIRKRFNIHKVALVGDRGMITSARIREDLLPVTLD